MADVLGSVVVQDLTYTQGRHGLALKISYVDGGVAGSETVALTDASGSEPMHLTVTIEDGVSTADEVKDAVELFMTKNIQAKDLVTIAVTGTGSNAQVEVADQVFAGEETPSTKDYYADQVSVPLTASFVAQPFGFHASAILIRNDETSGTDTVSWSFNGTDVGGVLLPTESILLDILSNGKAVISLKGDNAPAYRLEVVGM